ncbi:MAG TPA: TetR/AcrR family transcriptional regulator [Solirubrobacteraceae bacterium]|nr:TetR/AcrR family transcriptional regulator [Solirubrobacteraceae bacterium]
MTLEPETPKQRLLATASRLFYNEGIHGVGVDRIVKEARITRATFYRHYASKDALVEAYLRATHAELETRVRQLTAQDDARAALDALVDFIGDNAELPGFRGCHFINAAAEYPDPASAVRVAVGEHRRWFQQTVTELAARLGHPDPAQAGQTLVLLRDGALAGAPLDDPESIRDGVKSAAARLFELPG